MSRVSRRTVIGAGLTGIASLLLPGIGKACGRRRCRCVTSRACSTGRTYFAQSQLIEPVMEVEEGTRRQSVIWRWRETVEAGWAHVHPESYIKLYDDNTFTGHMGHAKNVSVWWDRVKFEFQIIIGPNISRTFPMGSKAMGEGGPLHRNGDMSWANRHRTAVLAFYT